MILVSACLVGINCNYKGSNSYNEKIYNLVREGKAIPVCPEQLGGLTTPRSGSERLGDKVINRNNEDVTEQYEKGAVEVLRLAKSMGITKAIMQPRSPSCGCGKIYDGTFSKTLIQGNGVTVELLKKNGIDVIPADEYFDEK